MKRIDVGVAVKLIPVTGVGVLLLSIIYDYSFFKSIGLGFSTVSTTLEDHVRSSIVWAPVVLLNAALYTVSAYSSNAAIAHDHIAQLDNIENSSILRTLHALHVFFLVVLIVMMWGVLFGIGVSVILNFLYTVPIGIGLFMLFLSKTGVGFTYLQKMALMLAIIVVCTAAVNGYRSGTSLKLSKRIWEVEFTSDDRENLSIIGLRQFSKEVIMVHPNGIIELIPRPQIKSISYRINLINRQRNICKWFGVYCRVPLEMGP